MLWLTAAPSFERLLLVELWLSFIYGSYNGAMVVYLTEIMPPRCAARASRWPTASATAIFGGLHAGRLQRR